MSLLVEATIQRRAETVQRCSRGRLDLRLDSLSHARPDVGNEPQIHRSDSRDGSRHVPLRQARFDDGVGRVARLLGLQVLDELGHAVRSNER